MRRKEVGTWVEWVAEVGDKEDPIRICPSHLHRSADHGCKEALEFLRGQVIHVVDCRSALLSDLQVTLVTEVEDAVDGRS